jgi:hypothetical protein
MVYNISVHVSLTCQTYTIGGNMRTMAGYRILAAQKMDIVDMTIKHRKWIW